MDAVREESLFTEALALSSEAEREAFLAEACGADHGLRARVEALLHAHEQPDQFLEPPQAGTNTTLYETVIREGPGTVIGPYKLLELLGEGGFGMVFLAEQRQPVRRMVALKILKPGMDTRQVIARFEAERQALALMEHPHIARVFDGGETASGRPYFVMELVRGVPITDYCEEHQLAPRQRLALFADVCQAVQHAHHRGIIHRDIKPRNILVATNDDRAGVKVIDFGIAKATGQQLTEKTLYTNFAQMVGTPLYMSPEQTQLSGLDVDTRTDIYSLGVLLYELLTGTTPFEMDRFKTLAYDELRRVIREEEPPRPSTRLSTLARATTTIPVKRPSDPRRLSQVCRGELDWIVMKALEKDRNRRYDSAGAFAADVQRYLDDEPVHACPPSAAYRFRKYLRRHKGPVLAVALILLILVTSSAGVLVGLFRALAAEHQAIAARDEKSVALRQTREALNTMTDEVVEDLLGQQVRLTDRHRAFLKKVLAFHEAFAAANADDPESRLSRADGYLHVGRIRESLGQLPEADAALHQAQSLYRQLVADFPANHDFRHSLVRCDMQLGQLLSEGNFVGKSERQPEAEAAYREAVLHGKQLVAASDRAVYRDDLASCEENLAVQLLATDRAREAEPLYRDSLALSQKLAQEFPNTPKYASGLAATLDNLAMLFGNTQRLKEAAEVYGQAVAAHQRLIALYLRQPDSRHERMRAELTLGVELNILRRSKDAEAAFGRAVALGKELASQYPLRPDIRTELALSLNNLGKVFQVSDRPREAASAWREALTLYKQLAIELPSRPDMRVQAAIQYHNLGIALIDSKQVKEGEAAWREGIALGEKLTADFPSRGRYRANLAFNWDELAHLMRQQNRLLEALSAWRTALGHYEKLGARQNIVLTHCNLGDVLGKMDGHRDQAIAECREAVRIDGANARAHYDLANLYFPDRLDEAIAEYRTAIHIQDDYAEAHTNLGNSLSVKGDLDAAIVQYRKALQINKDLFEAHVNFGVALKFKDRLDEAIREFRYALRLRPNDAPTHSRLAGALQAQGRPAEAIAEYRTALRLDKTDSRAKSGLREAEQSAALDQRLPAMLQGKDQPKNAGEFLGLAWLCQSQSHQQYASAARYFREAFSRTPALAEDLRSSNRYNAACAAALASGGQGKDAASLDASARAKLRQQAREWLEADLKTSDRLLAQNANAAGAVASTLRHWLEDPDLASVRDAAALARLPAAERPLWQKLWHEVTDLLHRAQQIATPAKQPAAR